MVLLPKQWKSRSPPGFEASEKQENPFTISNKAAAGPPSGGFVVLPGQDLRSRLASQGQRPPGPPPGGRIAKPADAGARRLRPNEYIAGWSSPVARQAHNLKVVGSNPTPATNKTSPPPGGLFCCPGEGRGPPIHREKPAIPAGFSSSRKLIHRRSAWLCLGQETADQGQRHEAREDALDPPRPAVRLAQHRVPPILPRRLHCGRSSQKLVNCSRRVVMANSPERSHLADRRPIGQSPPAT